LHNASDKLGLLITEGPHNDTQDLQVPAFRWFGRWLKGSDEQITDAAVSPFDPKQLKVFAELPADQRNTTAHEWFVPAATVLLPASKAEWEKQRERLLAELKAKCFRNWPKEGEPLGAQVVMNVLHDGRREQVIEFTSAENLRLPVFLSRGAEQKAASRLDLWVVGTGDWSAKLAAKLGPDQAVAVIAPTGAGPNQWTPKTDTHIRRRFVLLGRTVDDAKVFDTRRAVQAWRSRPEFQDAKITLRGDGNDAAIALYAGIFEPTVERFELTNLPASHRDGPTFLNVLRVLDMPQAVALAFPRAVILYEADARDWEWAANVAKLYGDKSPLQNRKSPKVE
jgi:hypothetical protein